MTPLYLLKHSRGGQLAEALGRSRILRRPVLEILLDVCDQRYGDSGITVDSRINQGERHDRSNCIYAKVSAGACCQFSIVIAANTSKETIGMLLFALCPHIPQ
jgi:hypothetical protein